ncbi:MAG: SEC-C domain-containing protein, partial [Planctomycetaceae bacterium]|nr:SEC-C domain-containing protein [Planctomycetaceae bacterium]
MKTGRNDPCHCGSGKKYKKCCLASDLAAEQSKHAKPLGIRSSDMGSVDDDDAADVIQRSTPLQRPAEPIPDPKPLDPKMEAINARWTEFENAAEDVRRELFIKTLDEPELMDDEMAYEMLNNLYDSTIASGERDVWDNLVEQLHQRLPDVYE